MNPNEKPTTNNPPTEQEGSPQTVADLSQSPATDNPESTATNKPVETPRPPAVQPSTDGAIIAPIGDELFHEPSLVKPKDNTALIIMVAAGVILIGTVALIVWLLLK
ncbi:MAG: hypothetical protein LBE03_02310 [Candidatus Nomurabacteria bacterium]|jgi:hypothetical protein|nr:hypothetical protein [Candidatus Nomurabacteria bacterium]